MGRPMHIHFTTDHSAGTSSIPLGLIGLFACISAIVALCAKHARRVTRNYASNKSERNDDQKLSLRSPLPSAKQFIATIISNKAIPFMYHKKAAIDDDHETDAVANKGEEGFGFGEGGLWQKEILMGEKCQPPEFPGVIYYDSCGNQISELPPKSPRASPLHNFSFQVLAIAKDEN